MSVKDRIKELRWTKASELIPHPHNWREHPPAQRAAMNGVLAEIGFADAVIARETPEGLQLIDGHLRQEVSGDQPIPVLIVDLTDEEADKMLVTLDPLAMMANANQDNLLALLESVKFEAQAVNDLLEALANGERQPMPTFEPVGEDEQGRLDEKAKVTCPECGHEFTP